MPKDRSEYNRRYYRENRERLLQKMKEYYQADPEKKHEHMRKWIADPENKAKRKAYSSEYAKRPYAKAADKRRKQEKKEYYRNYHREYYHKNKERINKLRGKVRVFWVLDTEVGLR
jgi:hypothetical protein